MENLRGTNGVQQVPAGESPEELWKKYIQLTEAESAFRALKSELAIRPIFHQKEHRVKAHILVAFLGYALWVTFPLRQAKTRKLGGAYRRRFHIGSGA